jgi:hypothetical protein
MKWLPYESFYIHTNLDPDAAQADLETEVSPEDKLILFPRFRQRRDGTFLGTIANGNFRIRPQAFNRNLFLPNISGAISPWTNGSRIQLAMRPHPLALLLICGWVSWVALFGIALLSQNPNVHFSGFATLVCALVAFGYLYMMRGFIIASDKAAKTLAEIFQGDVEKA